MNYKPIAYIHNGFGSKFGIPKQSSIADGIVSEIVFAPEYRNPDAVRGLEGFSHIWLLWEFSQSKQSASLTVRPPKLGGNKRMGVFATRSPFRPNPIGLSCVKIVEIDNNCANAPVIKVSSADLMNGTPIIDIKPYLPQFDCKPEALAGFSKDFEINSFNVVIPEKFEEIYPRDFIKNVTCILSNDPRPQYHNDPERIYGFVFENKEIKFRVADYTVEVTDIQEGRHDVQTDEKI
ncbi:MAG: tRNA (N6-threonylcarbamoyladenosine(37)-N6)-methyltransferase TrmO [Clostridia bacterium]|nr:tRNA (N6-threonylcarbamoyladenosine(37)-N6)-methyltransferase TrmO [Clostridia bacterium]